MDNRKGMPADGILVYHYTNINGLKGILQSQSVWATGVRFLSDATEGWFGLDALSRATSAEVAAMDPSSPLWQIPKLLERSTVVLQSFVACFSKNGDQLSQWSSYGQRGLLDRVRSRLPRGVWLIQRRNVQLG